MANKVSINPDICQSCGACIADCPKHILSMSSDLNKAGRTYAKYNGSGECIACGTCFRSCPSPGSITVNGEDNKTSDFTGKPMPEYEEMHPVLYNLYKKTFAGKRDLKTGNEAAVYGALLAGCTLFFGYPITPATEIAELSAEFYLPIRHNLLKLKKEGRYDGPIPDFLQAESEIASINMLYGSAGAGGRVMTGTSSPGFSLMTEGISYSAQSELPMVIIDLMRGGPGLGNIAPSQGDYRQLKAPGHGPFRLPIFMPNSAQEMCDLTMAAFDVAFKYRTPALVAADGDIGHGKENLVYPQPMKKLKTTPWAVHGDKETRKNIICSIHIEPDIMEKANLALQKKYDEIKSKEVRFEEYNMKDAEIVLIGYGSVSRTMRDVVDTLKGKMKIGLFRPITVWPFPEGQLRAIADNPKIKMFLVAEQSDGQMLEDVQLSVLGKKPVHFYQRNGGMRVTKEELVAEVRRVSK